MKYKPKNMKKGVSMALTAMMIIPTATPGLAAHSSIFEGEKNELIPYNVLNKNILGNKESTAKPAKDPMNVYTSFTQSVSSNAGDGSAQNPYNRFEDAVAQVANGGTIYILGDGHAFLNAQDELGHLPFLIDKEITIKPADGAKNAELSVRAGGIILGANVRFENIKIGFANKYHDSIFANGYTLDLINVTRDSGTRKIDLFAGGLHERISGVDNLNPIYPSGTKGVINIETNDNFGSDKYLSTFGNIYAGSMNGEFDGDAEITISNNGSNKKLDIGAIKASGALEADAGNMFDLTEPLPPLAKPDIYPTNGNVSITLNNFKIGVDGETGSNSKTSVTASSVYLTDLELKDVDHLTVDSGQIKAIYSESSTGVTSIPNVTVNNGATLDLTKAGDVVSIENYNGDGYVTLNKTGRLDITGKVEGTLNLQTDGAFGGKSGLVAQDHVYLTTPDIDHDIRFTPHQTQGYLTLSAEAVDSSVSWKLINTSDGASLLPILDLYIDSANAKVVKTYADLNPTPINGLTYYESVVFPFTSTIDFPPDDEYHSVDLNEYPFEILVNGIKAEYRDDKGIFIGGYHYFVKDLNLAIYFTATDDVVSDSDNLTILGYTEDFQLTGIDSGNYEFDVSYAKTDGTLTGFSTVLSVTDDVEQDDTKTGTSSIVLGDIGNLSLGNTVDIPVSITHTANTKSTGDSAEIGTAYLYVNGQKVSEQEVTPSSKSDITFNDVTINTSNNFKLGNNDILITYSGTETYNGSLESTTVEVIKATPELILNSGLQGSYTFDYDGTAKGVGLGIKNKVVVSVNGVALSDYEEKVLYRNTSLPTSEFTEELPFLPGEYETRIVVSEGEGYESTFIPGPSLTINRVQPKIKVSGVVNNGNLTVTAQVSSSSSALLPSGSAKFIIDGKEKATVKLTNGVASYTLAGLGGSTKTTTGEVATPEVKVVYVDDIIINAENNTSLYEEVESTPIEFKVANDWVSVTGVSLDEDVHNLNINGKTTLSAIINEDATNKDVIWSIGNSAIAEISENGVVTGISEGETYVTVMTVDGGFEATAIIRVSGVGEGPSEGEDGDGSTGDDSTGGGSTGGGSTGGGSTGGSNTGVSGSSGGNGSTDSDTNNNGDSNNGVEDANKPENKFKVNLEGLDEELKTKVDSLVTSVIAESQKEFMLSLSGDQEDLQHVTDVVINKDGIFIKVGNEQVKVTDKLPTTDIDFTNARVVRLVDNKFVPVMHYTNGEGLRITSSNINDLIITSKVKEPFTDVKDDAWYHDDVEEIFNYGFTQGTTATTYSPNNEITRGEFVVMIARALELKPSSEISTFKDIDGKWYQNEAQALYELGIIKGNTDGTFGGDNKITRQEAATFITRMLTHMNVDITVGNTVDFFDVDDISKFAMDSVQYLASQDILVGGGDNKFNPINNLTRAEMAKILVRSLKLSDWY